MSAIQIAATAPRTAVGTNRSVIRRLAASLDAPAFVVAYVEWDGRRPGTAGYLFSRIIPPIGPLPLRVTLIGSNAEPRHDDARAYQDSHPRDNVRPRQS